MIVFLIGFCIVLGLLHPATTETLNELVESESIAMHAMKIRRVFLVNGIRQHTRKKKKCLESGEPFHIPQSSS